MTDYLKGEILQRSFCSLHRSLERTAINSDRLPSFWDIPGSQLRLFQPGGIQRNIISPPESLNPIPLSLPMTNQNDRCRHPHFPYQKWAGGFSPAR
jgi:hypothetical protein